MKSLALALVLASAPAFAGSLEHPILGGTQATPDQFPSVVAIELGGGLCSGTLITKDWVLTAAHCVSPAVIGMSQSQITASVKVHFGTVNIRTAPGTIVRASETIPHTGFDINNLGVHDIGLIKLATPVTNVTPLPINLVTADAPVGMALTMVGFGATAQGGGGSVGIEYIVAQTSIACAANVGTDANLLCFNQLSGKGKCEGDSGGPSFAAVRGAQVQVGITSFGDQNCAQFGADTRVDAEKAFLLQHVPELECSVDTDCPDMKACFQHRCMAQPFSPMGLGTTCTANTECDSGTCAQSTDGGKCSMSCTVGAAETCPSGFDCIASGGGGACWPTAKDDSGCNAGGGSPAPALFGLGLVALVLRRRR
ncbi:MAG: serine protease [Myxococcales bacterium]|nr:serine protease [Myxococcales bacterium]